MDTEGGRIKDTKFSVAVHILILISESEAAMKSEDIARSVNTNASYTQDYFAFKKCHRAYEDTLVGSTHTRKGGNGTMGSKIGVVDVGGGYRGIYAAGVLDYCLENKILFDLGIGVSAGSANVISYAAGRLGYGPASIFQIGAAIAANSGPKVAGISFIRKKDKGESSYI